MDNILIKLENISTDFNDKILIIKGEIKNNKVTEEIEILIFRGFSSSTTHPTEYDLEKSTIPIKCKFKTAILTFAPLEKNFKIIRGPLRINQFLKKSYWK